MDKMLNEYFKEIDENEGDAGIEKDEKRWWDWCESESSKSKEEEEAEEGCRTGRRQEESNEENEMKCEIVPFSWRNYSRTMEKLKCTVVVT